MKKWEEQRKKKLYNQKIGAAKSTLKTQPKGARVNKTPGLQNTGPYNEQVSGMASSQYPTRGRAEYADYDEMESNFQGQYMEDQNVGMFNLPPQQEYSQRSPAVGMASNLNYQHMNGMNATAYNSNIRRSQGQVMASGDSLGTQYTKPKMKVQNSHYGGNKKSQQFNLDSKTTISRRETSKGDFTNLPIYQLLKAFKLQQYTRKMNDLGYGHDVYKLALLSSQQRDEFVTSLKVMPGHKAKLAGFFSVIDGMYPRQVVMEQISAVTPNRPGKKKNRITSAGRTRYHLGPQKTLLQQYEKLDKYTKQAFNQHFQQSLVGVKQNMGQLFEQHVDLEESSQAINQIFPPDQFFRNEYQILEEAQATQNKGFINEMEELVNKFTTGPQAQKQFNRLSTNNSQSKGKIRKNRSNSRDRKLTVNDRLTQEVENKLKQQRKHEKERIKQYGQIYGGDFSTGNTNVNSGINLQNYASKSNQGQKRSASKDRRVKSSNVTSQVLRDQKNAISLQKYQQQTRRNQAYDTEQISLVHQPIDESTGGQQVQEDYPESVNIDIDNGPGMEQQQQYAEEPEQYALPIDDTYAQEQLNEQLQNEAMTGQDVVQDDDNEEDDEYQMDFEQDEENQQEEQEVVKAQSQLSKHSDAPSMFDQEGAFNESFKSGINVHQQFDGTGGSSGGLALELQQIQSQKQIAESNTSEDYKQMEQQMKEMQEQMARQNLHTGLEQDTMDLSMDMSKIERHTSELLTPAIETSQQELGSTGNYQNDEISVQTPEVDLSEPRRQAPEPLTTFDNQERFKMEIQEMPKRQIKPAVERKLSPMLDPAEKHHAMNLGQSMDSKKVTSALGYLDLKQICYCLAQALDKHIKFSQGNLFLDDLKASQVKKDGDVVGTDIDFSYHLKDGLKIDVEASKQRQVEKQKKKEEANEKFQELQKQITAPKEMPKKTPKQFTSTKIDSDEEIPNDKFRKDKNKTGDGEIDDDTILQSPDDQIEDFYEDQVTPKQDQDPEDGIKNTDGEDLDMDYSQSQLDNFLASQSKGGVNSHQLMQSFISTYNKTKSINQNQKSARGQANSMSTGNKRERSNSHNVEPIQEREDDLDDLDNDDIARTPEVINLDEIKANNEQAKKSLKTVKDEIKFDKFDVSSKSGFKELLRFQMRIYDQNYNFEEDCLHEAEYSGNPSIEELYYYCKYIIISGRMEKEIPILCLVYIERFLTKSGLLMNHLNWKRLTLISLILASKIWDDDSLENVHFPQVMSDITLKEISGLEKVFLQVVDYDVVIKGSEYAKYYFILKTFAESFNSSLPMGPLTVDQMSELMNKMKLKDFGQAANRSIGH